MVLPTREQMAYLLTADPAERRLVFAKSFVHFFAYFWFDEMEHALGQLHAEMAADLADIADGKLFELVWVMFRGSAKTTMAKAFLVWCIAFEKFRYPNVDSFDKVNSGRFLFDVIVFLQTNQPFITDFGQLFNADRSADQKTQKTVYDFLTNNGIRVEAHSTQESVRGRISGTQRPDLVICDDFETAITVRSEVMTRNVREHFAEFKGGLDPVKSAVIYLGNYQSETGNVAALLARAENNPRMRKRFVPVETDGVPAWPERFAMGDEPGKVSIARLRADLYSPETGNADFLREFMLDPAASTFRPFTRELFRSVPKGDVDRLFTSNYLLIDPPGTDYSRSQRQNDFCGIALVKLDANRNWYVEAWRARLTPAQIIETMFSIADSERVTKIALEDTQFTQGLDYSLEQESIRRGRRLPIAWLKASHGKARKADRIAALKPLYENRVIYHVEARCGDLEDELLRFPVLDHDDTADALSFGLEVCEPPRSSDSVAKSTPTQFRPRFKII
jgi:predicted phage terminase large subunit-like protein